MKEKIFVQTRKRFIPYTKLLDLDKNDKVLVNADDFYKVYPRLVKINPASMSEIRKIYIKVASTSTKNILTPSDTIRMPVRDAIIYFEKVQNYTTPMTFRDVKEESKKNVYSFPWNN